MRLERLEISGFKSFSDRAELSFDRGVTAIVGPNGCGKSNVADALTWVMGEQSAKSLRGEKMEDVIFSGSDARKPTGAAEVRLRFSGVAIPPTLLPGLADEAGSGEPSNRAGTPAGNVIQSSGNGNGNGNGHHGGNGHSARRDIGELLEAVREVEVTRRLYRSGESEYLIDGQICRLRDIHELLMDTGLGAKAYAIIEQGKIGMILSSRPTDRRQLIEEAAGITKYKARRRAAELKLEAAQQNLVRIDDIVFEVEKQLGSLRRQAAKARRYARLRDEMRRWEKVLFTRRYRALAEVIESTRARVADVRQQETAAAARLAEVENELGKLRIDLAEAESAAMRARDAAHAGELEINRRQQQIALDLQQAEMLQARSAELETERDTLVERREPERIALEDRRASAAEAARTRDEAAAVATTVATEYAEAQHAIELAECQVEEARNELYAVTNTVTALTAALEAATVQRERLAETLTRLGVEAADVQTEHDRALSARITATNALTLAQEQLQATQIARAAKELELAKAREEHEWRAREIRTREPELASLLARLASLEELDAHRAGFSDAARMLLVEANGQVNQMGAVADVVEVEPQYERAVEACLGELLEHVIVNRHEHAAAGLSLVREQDAGRCGFVVLEGDQASAAAVDPAPWAIDVSGGAVLLSSVIRIATEHEGVLRDVIEDAIIVDSFDAAKALAASQPLRVATLDGDLLKGTHLVTGGGKLESRGILATKREIKELRERVPNERLALNRLSEEVAALEQTIARATASMSTLTDELHRQEKDIVAIEAELNRAAAEEARLGQRRELVAAETARVREEIAGVDGRQTEARESVSKLDEQRVVAESALGQSQRALLVAREKSEALAQRVAEARATHAALIERSAAVFADVARLEEASHELERRVQTCASDLTLMRDQRQRLVEAVAEGRRLLDEDVRRLEELRVAMRKADEHAFEIKATAEAQEVTIRDARRALDLVRALAAELDVTRATAEAELTHLAQQCLDAVNVSLDAVRVEVEAMEEAGQVEPDAEALRAVEQQDAEEEIDQEFVSSDLAVGTEPTADVVSAGLAPQRPVLMTAEDAITELRAKIDRLGPVNMMAIEQFGELETRHVFLTTQRQDLVDSIAQTNQAIKRIDETTHARFHAAFTAINANFQVTFSTLFGGGHAGITLLDENDPLESGIDIVASPPGKRLQNVMLLSGGEKALAAIALMFAIFRYKPSPFCVLDEIDAPLDDANIARFVEMLRGMLDRTQFIIITHNRKTMEIANRLYGVTMEEPGVSKLISIQLN